ncbi:MAG: hypothetical protein ACRC8S_10120 [Fimbriiglobus sp.]
MEETPMKSLFAISLALLAVVSNAVFAQDTPQKPLQYKYAKGDVEKYEILLDQDINFEVKEVKVPVKNSYIIHNKRTITEIDKKGNYKCQDELIRMGMKIKSDAFSIDADTNYKEDQEDDNPGSKMLQSVFKEMKGLKFTSSLSKQGAPSNSKIDKKSYQKFLDNIPENVGEKLKPEELAQQGGAVLVLPEKFPKINDTWKHKAETKTQGTKMQIDITYKYLGTESIKNRELHKIGMTMDMVARSSDDAPITLKIGKQKSSGTAYFDNDAGRLVKLESQWDADVDATNMGIEMTGTMAMKIQLRPIKD